MSQWLLKPICVFFLLFLLRCSEMNEKSEECETIFNEVDDGEWDISDDNDDDLRSDSEKE